MASPRVLVVDDEDGVRESLRVTLEKDCDVHLAPTGDDAVAFLEADSVVDVVTLDLRMPGMPGLAALERIKGIDRDIEILVITGNASLQTARQSLQRWAFDYLTKPFDAEEVRRTVLDAFARRTAVFRLRAGADLDPQGIDDTAVGGDYVDALAYVADIDRGFDLLSIETVDVAAVVTALVEEIAPRALRRGVSLRADVAPAPVRTDREKVERMLRSLITHAVRYTPIGKILVSVRPSPGVGVVVEVLDTGIGLARDILAGCQLVTERLAPPPPAFGLDLKVAARILRALAGQISAPGTARGTRMRVVLPALTRLHQAV
jgi:CheY-like chemotaxis protein